MANDFVNLGIIGATNITILSLITLIRTIRFLQKCSYDDLMTMVYRKKLVFHIFLLLASVVDLPYYFSLAVYGNFSLVPYSFHKLESAFLFAALSITISDWGVVLHDINELTLFTVLIRRGTLIAVNIVYMSISFANFIVCLVMTNIDVYLDSPLYTATIFFQISMAGLVSILMLNAGIKLSLRIQGAAGVLDSTQLLQNAYSRFTTRIRQVSLSSMLYRQQEHTEATQEFRNALVNLNLVMGTCCACILLQTIMSILNYTSKSSSSTDKTAVNIYFYWTCYYWLPIWGIVLSLLYLARAHAPRKTFRSELHRSNIPAFSNNALIGEEDDLLLEDDANSGSGLGGGGMGIHGGQSHNHNSSDLHTSLLNSAHFTSDSSGNYLRGNMSSIERTVSNGDQSVISSSTGNDDLETSLNMTRGSSIGALYDAMQSPHVDMYQRGGILSSRLLAEIQEAEMEEQSRS